MGSVVQLARDEWRAPEQPEKCGENEHHCGALEHRGLVLVEESVVELLAVAAATGHTVGVRAGQSWPGEQQEQTDNGNQGRARRGLHPVLPPGEPGHRSTSTAG